MFPIATTADNIVSVLIVLRTLAPNLCTNKSNRYSIGRIQLVKYSAIMRNISLTIRS